MLNREGELVLARIPKIPAPPPSSLGARGQQDRWASGQLRLPAVKGEGLVPQITKAEKRKVKRRLALGCWHWKEKKQVSEKVTCDYQGDSRGQEEIPFKKVSGSSPGGFSLVQGDFFSY